MICIYSHKAIDFGSCEIRCRGYFVGNYNLMLFKLFEMRMWCIQDYYKRPGCGVGIWEGSLGCEFLRGLMCAEGMGCGRRWVRWVLRGTGTATGV